MRWIVRIIGLLIVLVAIAAAGAYWALNSSLPDYAGDVTLEGPTAKIRIVRDENAIPHIEAQNLNDAAFGLGYAHAQDRLWQMEMNRRVSQGRMSEVFGKATIGTDKFLRTLGIDQKARAAQKVVSEETRALLDAYAKGVNAYLETRSGLLPPEFLVLGAKPDPWEPRHSLGWLKMMAWDLGANWNSELARLELAGKLTPEQISQFFAPYPGEAPTALAGYQDLYRSVAKKMDVAALRDALPKPPGDGIGSNNWVVSGAHTESGKPLVANDPHLGLTAPAVWYFAHLKTPEGEAIGATLPGVPGVILGHNGKMAWGFTNTGPDVQDLFLEKINPANDKEYMTPDGPKPFVTREEVIKVSGGDPVTITVRETRHGPVLSDIHERSGGLAGKEHVLAFSWTALADDDASADLLAPLLTAQSPQDYINTFRKYVAPQQNMVFADSNGNIGYIAPGRVPLRRADNDIKGKAPAPGWEAKYDWQGFIPYEGLPRTVNPSSGMVITANNRVVPWDYPYYITDEWTAPYRAIRINELMAKTEKHTIESFKTIQLDVVSVLTRDLLPILTAAAKPTDDRGKAVLAAMKDWNSEMTSERPEPLIFSAWYRELSRAIAKDEMGDSFERNWKMRPVFISNVLNNVDGSAAWCAQNGDKTTCADLIAKSFDTALAGLTKTYGDDWRSWRWGTAHTWVGKHRPFHEIAQLAGFFDIVHPAPGDTVTVNVARTNIKDEDAPYVSNHAASLRAIYDLADLNKSIFVHSTGQSGHVLSAHYSDLSNRWAVGRYVPMHHKAESYNKNALGVLTLSPK